ncbi:NAD(P)-binding domain-containing protein [Chitinophaga sedimenti]|uniref:NAD(P)-binding domain-containing protein n=1 Tax=Chitinophaga sedimenti TaxID=2033606 RepID=UPI00249EC199|nr:NAD(P)-binding domain-containing protein [Chitinophaga sedimenti]
MGNKIGIIGSGSWATALAKILTDNGHQVGWWIRNEDTIRHLQTRHHNKHYLTSVYFDTQLLHLSNSVADIIAASEYIILAVPSAFLREVRRRSPMMRCRIKSGERHQRPHSRR